MIKRKSTFKAKLRAASQEERIHLRKEHFKNLLGKSPKITVKPIPKIVYNQQDIKLGQFPPEEHDKVLKKFKNRKPAGLEDILPKIWKIRKFDNLLFRYCDAVYNQNTIERWTKGCTLSPPQKKRWPGIAKNCRRITLTSIVAKIYNAMLLKHIEPEIEKIFGRVKMVFGKTDPQHHRFWQSDES